MREDNPAQSSAASVSMQSDGGTGLSADRHSELLEALNRLEEDRRHANIALGAVAHDMKAPVAIVSGYLKLLCTEKLGPLNERQREILDDMHMSCVRMQHLISQFLTYGAIGAEAKAVNFEMNDLNATLQEVCRDWVPLCRVRSVSLDFVPSSEIPMLAFDHQKIKQAVACLIDNALKFTPTGKTVRLIVEPHFWERRLSLVRCLTDRRVSKSHAANSVQISVIDSGPGIPAEYQQEVFEEYYTRRCGEVESSTGLGLAIARRVSQAHGGKIWVESTVGVGSKFCIVLPFKRKQDKTVVSGCFNGDVRFRDSNPERRGEINDRSCSRD